MGEDDIVVKSAISELKLDELTYACVDHKVYGFTLLVARAISVTAPGFGEILFRNVNAQGQLQGRSDWQPETQTGVKVDQVL